jgi:Molybdopterin-binding domain of aldehyde dehydrogenase
VIARDVGGGFGQKGLPLREDMCVLLAAKKLPAALKWIEDRQENLTAAGQARHEHGTARIALDDQGVILAATLDHVQDVGALHHRRDPPRRRRRPPEVTAAVRTGRPRHPQPPHSVGYASDTSRGGRWRGRSAREVSVAKPADGGARRHRLAPLHPRRRPRRYRRPSRPADHRSHRSQPRASIYQF